MKLNRAAWVGLFAAVGACTTVRSIQPAEYLADNTPEVVWVTETNNTVVPVTEAVVTRDTLRGVALTDGKERRVKIPLTEIRTVQAKVHDHTKTAILVGTVGVVAASTIYFGLISKSGGSGTTIDCTGDEVTKHPTEHPRVLFLSRVALGGLFVAAAPIGACTSVRRVQPVEYLADNAPEVVWVTDTNNTVVSVTEAVVTRDTLQGMELSQGRGQRVKIPLGEIRSVQAKVPDHTKTALLAATLGVATVSALYFAYISKAGPGGNDTTCGLDSMGDPIQEC